MEGQQAIDLDPPTGWPPQVHFASAGVAVIMLDRKQAAEVRDAMAWAAKRMSPAARLVYMELHEWLESPTAET